MTGLEIVLLYGAYKLVRGFLSPAASTATPPPQGVNTKPVLPPGKVVTFLGRAGAGKSSTANALLGRPLFPTGIEHGTTAEIAEAEHPRGYRLRDTPGLLDETDYLGTIWPSLEDSAIIVFITNGQLYRQELDLIPKIHASQQQWDRLSNTNGRRKLLVFVNFQDVKRRSMPKIVREKEAESIRAQVSPWIPARYVVFGSASISGEAISSEIDELSQSIEAELLY